MATAKKKVVRKKGTTKKASKKTTKTSSPSDDKTRKKTGNAAEAWFEKMQSSKKFQGRAQIVRASDDNTPYYLRRPTGIPSLDVALGGGIHAGGVTEVHGAQSSGKTGFALRVAGQVQRVYQEDTAIMVSCTEAGFDKSYARRNGLHVAYSDKEIEKFSVDRAKRGDPPFTAEEIADLRSQTGFIGIIKGKNGADLLDATAEAIISGHMQLVIIDSMGGLLTPAEEEKDIGEATYAGAAGIITKFINKIYPAFMMAREDGEMLETSVLGINQARALIGGGPRAPTTRAAAGAYAWKHSQLASIELKKAASLKNGTTKVGHEIKWGVVKGKAGTHDGLKGEFDYYHVPKEEPAFWSDYLENRLVWGPDMVKDIVDTSKKVGAVKVAGAWLNWEEDGKSIVRANGVDAFVEHIVNDLELIDKLYQHCMNNARISVKYR